MSRFTLVGLSALLGCCLALPVFGQQPSAGRTSVVASNNAFAFDLYAKLREKDGNLVFSPTSISTAFGLASAGARDQTLTEIEKALHFDLPQDKLHPAFAELMKQLNGAGRERKFQLTIANALWGQKDYPFRADYLNLTRTYYGAGLQEVNFKDNPEEARKTINRWVEKETKDKIKDLLGDGSVTADTRLVLTNAIYFKSAWSKSFIESETKEESFHLGGGKKLDKVKLMHQTNDFSYYEGDTLQALALPYEGYELSLLVLLPKKPEGLPELEKSLTAAKVEEWVGKLKGYNVNVTLPKFKFSTDIQLNEPLQALGMRKAFEPNGADFSGMTGKRDLFLSAAVHKAFVDVHEKGTEAAAATGLTFSVTSAPLPKPKAVFRADHPFAFVIRENATGAVLFIGRVVNPQ